MTLLFRAVIASVLLASAVPPARLPAAEPSVLVTRIIDRVPHTPQEVEEAHGRSDLLCVPLPAGTPLAERNFTQQVRYEVTRPPSDGGGTDRVLYNFGRWPAVAYGTRMSDEDKKSLPYFTSGSILSVVENTYTSLQVRVHRAAPDGEPYLYYLPYACIGEYGKPEKSVEFADLQTTAIKDVRGLGLFLEADRPRDPRALRTLVVSIRSTMILPNDKPDVIQTKPILELLLVRLRVAAKPANALAAAVELHAFVTSDDLTKLVYFKPYATPADADKCDLLSTIRITEYALAGQVPSARAARDVRVVGGREFTIAALDEYAAQAGLGKSAFDHVSEVLDAIIDGAVK